MTIEDFLEETAEQWDKKSFKEANDDLSRLSNDAWIRKWGPSIMSNKNMVADFYNLKNFKPLPERLTSAFKEFKFAPSDAWKQQIYQSEFTDVPRDEFERVLSNMKKYYEEEIAKQDSIKARKDREQEIKKWPLWKDVLASDYAKQRYIEEPETALIGEQAPALGKASNTRWGAGADLAAGTVAAAADFVPSAWWLGPAIRTGRDIGYSVSDSKYAKDPGDWFTERVADAGINLGARFLANARRGQRIANEMTNPEVARTLNADAATDAINESLTKVNSVSLNAMNDKELINTIKDLPETSFKSDLLAAISTAEENLGRPVNRQAVLDAVNKYRVETNPAIQDAARGIREGKVVVVGEQGPYGKNASTYLKDVAQTTPYEQLSKPQQASYLYNKLVGKVNKGALGQVGVQTAANLQGRGHSEVTYDKSEEFERLKEYYKQTRGEDWLKYGPAFAPKQEEGSPAWEAYKEVMGIK